MKKVRALLKEIIPLIIEQHTKILHAKRNNKTILGSRRNIKRI